MIFGNYTSDIVIQIGEDVANTYGLYGNCSFTDMIGISIVSDKYDARDETNGWHKRISDIDRFFAIPLMVKQSLGYVYMVLVYDKEHRVQLKFKGDGYKCSKYHIDDTLDDVHNDISELDVPPEFREHLQKIIAGMIEK
jgi:hypothetical protein